MKLLAFIALGISFSPLIMAQTPSFIEVAVDEQIELKAKSVTVDLFVIDEYSQREAELYNYYEEDYYYESEEDYYYEEMLANSPKKVTKEMKEAYAQRQLDREARLAEQAAREAEFVPFLTTDLMRVLDEKGIAYTIKGRAYSMDNYYDGMEGSDTTLQVALTSEEAYNALFELVAGLQVYTDVSNISYEELDDLIELAIPKLTAKANKQAGILAASMQRKLGKIIHCTNVFPNGASPSLLNQLYNNMGYLNFREESNRNPFEKSQPNVISYIYRYELLN